MHIRTSTSQCGWLLGTRTGSIPLCISRQFHCYIISFQFKSLFCKHKHCTSCYEKWQRETKGGKRTKTAVSPGLTANPGDSHFYRRSYVQSGTLDHDAQHPGTCGRACVQVREHGRGKAVEVKGCGLAFSPSSAFFVSLLWISYVLCEKRRQKSKLNLALNPDKILTSSSFFMVLTFTARAITTSSSKGWKNLLRRLATS